VSTSVDRSPFSPVFQSRRIEILSVQDEREETTPVDHNNNADMDISPKRRDATDGQGAAAPKTMAEEIIKNGDIAKKADEYTKELDQASNLFFRYMTEFTPQFRGNRKRRPLAFLPCLKCVFSSFSTSSKWESFLANSLFAVTQEVCSRNFQSLCRCIHL
jgi:hypothetical protein